jgi:uncharacterized protein
MWDDFLRAIALVLVIEGMLPFATPNGWREAMRQAGNLPNNVLRIIGLISMLGGVLLLYLMHSL